MIRIPPIHWNAPHAADNESFNVQIIDLYLHVWHTKQMIVDNMQRETAEFTC